MPISPRRHPVALLLLAALCAVVVWGVRGTSQANPAPAPAAAVPTAQAVGKVTIPGLVNSVTYNATIRSFTAGGTSSGEAGGGGGGGTTGVFMPAVPSVGLDSAPTTPALLQSLATGRHMPTATVVLFRPGTTTRMEEWKYTDVMLKQLDHSQAGPPSRQPRVALTWTFRKVQYTTYATNGSTVQFTSCFDKALNAGC